MCALVIQPNYVTNAVPLLSLFRCSMTYDPPLVRVEPDRRRRHQTIFGGRRTTDPSMPSPHVNGAFSHALQRHAHESERVLWVLQGTALPTLRCTLAASAGGIEL